MLNIDLDPKKVDVNVHPAKLEVRFQEDNKVFKAVYHAIKDTLLKSELVANTEKTVEEVENNLSNITKTTSVPKNSGFTDLFKKITKLQEKHQKEDFSNPIEDIYKMKEKDIQDDKEAKIEKNINDINSEYNKEDLKFGTEDMLNKKDKMTDKFENKYNKTEQNNTSIIEEILGKKTGNSENINVNNVLYSKDSIETLNSFGQNTSSENETIRTTEESENMYNKKKNDSEKEGISGGIDSSKIDIKSDIQGKANTIGQDKKMDVFKELMAMQQRLKQEAQNDPTLNTNIDTIIENTEKLKNKEDINFEKETKLEDNEISPIKEELSNERFLEKNETSYDNVRTYDVEENKKEIQNSRLKEDAESYQIIEKGPTDLLDRQTYANVFKNIQKEAELNKNIDFSDDINTTSQGLFEENMNNVTEGNINENGLYEEDVRKEDINASNIDEKNINEIEAIQIDRENINGENYKIDNTEKLNKDNYDDMQATRIFTSAEIQEMMDKLEKIDNVDESPEFADMYEKIFGKLPASVEEEKKKEQEKFNAYELIKDNNISVFEDIEEFQKPVYKLIGIAFNTYIIIEIQNELYIIDQHAAHERVMYEKVKENYYSDTDKDSQMLLLPDIITLTHKEMDILKDNLDMFEKAGFSLEEFGDNTIKLTGVPNICLELDTKELFLETLDEINQVARTAKQEIEERFIATVACKAAVKANMNLDSEEVDSLMDELLKLPNPFTCPHGRPTAIKMDKNDIEKKFARRK